MRPRRRLKRGDEPYGQAPTQSSDDSGCLLLIVGLLWYFGVVSFHWGQGRREERQLQSARSELQAAQRELAMTQHQLADLARLSAEHAELQQQVRELESTRDRIATNLAAASAAVAPPMRSRWRIAFDWLFGGVPGNLTSAAILALCAVMWRWARRRKSFGAAAA